jgi:1,2-dihydroxy-3-keto-5-methylthiopentene dioxygenase
MAILQLDDGTTFRNTADIARALAPLCIQLIQYPQAQESYLSELLGQDSLSDQEKSQILRSFDYQFRDLRQKAGYVWYDLLILHPGSPNLYALTENFSRYHTHSGSEALSVLAGEAIFGFVRPDRSHVQLLVQPEDYIHIPAGTEHWFSPAASLHFKAIRYFTTVADWAPHYTGTEVINSSRKLR